MMRGTGQTEQCVRKYRDHCDIIMNIKTVLTLSDRAVLVSHTRKNTRWHNFLVRTCNLLDILVTSCLIAADHDCPLHSAATSPATLYPLPRYHVTAVVATWSYPGESPRSMHGRRASTLHPHPTRNKTSIKT